MTKYLSNKIKGINVLMTLFVIMMHCTWDDMRFSALLILTDVAVPTFFCISSFLYFRDFKFSQAQYLRKLKSRIISLIVPFLAYNLFLYFYYLVTAYYLHLFPSKVVPTSPFDFAIYIFESKADPPLWYLLTLFQFVIIAPLIGWLVSRLPLLCILIFIFGGVFSIFEYNELVYWLPVIFLGAIIAIHKDTISAFVAKKRIPTISLCILSLMFLAAMCFLFYGIGDNRAHHIVYYYYRIVAPIVVICIYWQFDIVPHKIVERTASLCIFFYGIHFPIKEAATALLRKVDMPFEIKYAIILILTLTTAYTVAIILKCVKPLWSVLTGGRA